MNVVIPVMYKSGVSLKGVQAVTVLGIQMAARAFAQQGHDEMWVTSVMEGDHMGGSLHYEGLAFDVRTRHLTTSQIGTVAAELRGVLESEWDVVIEGSHIHIEFDPKT